MSNEIDALNQAIQYAQEQVDWYNRYAFWKMFLFRSAGVITILATVAITYLSASVNDKSNMFAGFKKQNLITGLAVISAISVALSTFFGWQKAWESHRLAQFQIEAAIVNANIKKSAVLGTGRKDELVEEAQKLTEHVKEIVLSETDRFYRTPDKQNGERGN